MALPLEDRGWLVRKTEDYDAHIVHEDGRWWVHNRVFRWSHIVCRRLLEDIEKLSRAMQEDLWAMAPPPSENPHHPHFMQMVGWQREQDEQDATGEYRAVYVKKYIKPQ